MYDHYAWFASWYGPVRQARVLNSSYESNIQNVKLKLYKARSQINPPMHVIPQDMVCCQVPLRLLACWNPGRCLSQTLERGQANWNSQRVPKNVSKGGSTVSDVSHLVYFALFLPTCRAKTPNPMQISFFLDKEKEHLMT